MAKQVGQIRWFGPGVKNNYPATLTLDMLRNGTAFPRTYPIVQLGVQTLPGTKFYLNASETPIVVGATGIYELSVEGLANITSIMFDNGSLETIGNNQNAYIIIDFIYETE